MQFQRGSEHKNKRKMSKRKNKIKWKQEVRKYVMQKEGRKNIQNLRKEKLWEDKDGCRLGH
jgi:hypothetical protein